MPGETQRQVINRLTLHGMRVMRGLENDDVQGLATAYRSAQDDIVRILQNVFATTSTPGSWNIGEMAAAGRDAEVFQSIQGRLQVLQAETGISIEQSALDQFRNSQAWTAFGLDQGTPVDRAVQVPVLPEAQIRALINTPFEEAMFSQRVSLIDAEMTASIRNQLTRSMINGESMQQAAGRIEGVLGANNPADPRSFANRATTIARTEIMRAQNLGKFSVYQENSDLIDGDPEEAWLWVVTPDADRLCPWCRRREGKTPKQIRKAAAGRDPWGKSTSLPLHPHCRCTSYPKLKSFRDLGIDMPDNFKDDERGMRDPITGKWEVQSEEQFDEWKARRPDAVTV